MFYRIFVLIMLMGFTILLGQSNQAVEKEITFKSCGLTLSGTLTLPAKGGKFPCIILISGGYPDTRDAEVLDFKSFKVLSDHFLKNGYATFRYDDRGVGRSEGKHTWQYTAFELADDVTSAYQYLAKHHSIESSGIGLCGHSFGAIISPYVYSIVPQISFIIYLSGMGTTFEEQWISYREYSLANSNFSPEVIGKIANYDKGIITRARDSKNWDSLHSELLEKTQDEFTSLPEEQAQYYNTFEEYKNSSYYGVLSEMIVTPFAESLWDYTPLPYLRKIKCPILILLGENDESMPPHIHYKPLNKTMQRTGVDYEIHIIKGVNHHYTQSYEPGMTYKKEFLEVISEWLRKM